MNRHSVDGTDEIVNMVQLTQTRHSQEFWIKSSIRYQSQKLMYVSKDRYDLAMFLIFLDFQDKKDTEQTGKSHDEDYDTHVFDI